MRTVRQPFLLGALLAVTGCAGTPVPAQAGSGTIDAINHTHWAINHFSVNGQGAVDAIGPNQGGGGCCFSAPAQWKPEMTVRVDWETGASGVSELADEFPGFADRAKYRAWRAKVNAEKRQHSRVVPVPSYSGEDTCGITVHFLPCDQLKVTTSCLTYDNPNYPVKEPLKLPEPKSCPQ
ncbi:DUF3304 domain-containing protein [Pseudomonas sp. GD04087]|uniref:DUF3304 domain-containing protein n=1 Tax=unclassified Pseudomonas TaxID=196821 RepID=UPI00244D09C5|nr:MULTISPECIES: DUF3304 domain-containing protein [unclassified Pseudomonas]MDH0292896.1 DUF3304 domain-containing protein [Pseudomonas sp. GD04087]MDH1050028.1 DUF3304 domain-containing protein [Pseudomonas sp. GD03903]MDH2001882.1 DUF3304 domain-containing protein [Pseudomonas sp. GD03691]